MKGADGESGWTYDGLHWWVRCHAASTVPWIVKVREGLIWAINDGLSARVDHAGPVNGRPMSRLL
jgi:hypothetical protein